MRQTAGERFWAKVDRSGGLFACWEWTASIRHSGYGCLGVDGKTVYAHRWAWEAANGPIPPGLDIDHLCRNRACVNPTHLEPVTRQENIRRGVGYSALNARRTHCPSGHPYSAANTLLERTRSGLARRCRTCGIGRRRRRNARQRAARAEARMQRCQ